MTPRRRLAGLQPAVVAVVLVALASSSLLGCASPEPTYFTLAALPGTAQPGSRLRTVELRRPGLAGYLDRPEIVRASNQYQLRLASAERWGEPLGDLIGRVLAENLTTRLPGTSVFTSAGSISTDADAAVELDVQRFDLDASGNVVLFAQVAIQRGRGRSPVAARSVRVQTRPGGASTPDLVAAMSAALAQASDQVAALLRGVPAG